MLQIEDFIDITIYILEVMIVFFLYAIVLIELYNYLDS